MRRRCPTFRTSSHLWCLWPALSRVKAHVFALFFTAFFAATPVLAISSQEQYLSFLFAVRKHASAGNLQAASESLSVFTNSFVGPENHFLSAGHLAFSVNLLERMPSNPEAIGLAAVSARQALALIPDTDLNEAFELMRSPAFKGLLENHDVSNEQRAALRREYASALVMAYEQYHESGLQFPLQVQAAAQGMVLDVLASELAKAGGSTQILRAGMNVNEVKDPHIKAAIKMERQRSADLQLLVNDVVRLKREGPVFCTNVVRVLSEWYGRPPYALFELQGILDQHVSDERATYIMNAVYSALPKAIAATLPRPVPHAARPTGSQAGVDTIDPSLPAAARPSKLRERLAAQGKPGMVAVGAAGGAPAAGAEVEVGETADAHGTPVWAWVGLGLVALAGGWVWLRQRS